MLSLRDAKQADFEKIMIIYRCAQDYMISHGNPTQWGHSYPDPELVKSDISEGICKVICDENDIHGVLVLIQDRDPDYDHIEGEWLNGEPYIAIHRIASDGQVHGLFKCALEYCQKLSSNIRIDTHADNITMQRLIEKNGFKKCGIVYIRDGSPRIAYHWTAL